MKILRDTEWELVSYQEDFNPSGGKPVFFFQHRKYQYVLALNVAKYIDVINDVVYYCCASRDDKISVSRVVESSRVGQSIQGLLNKCGL